MNCCRSKFLLPLLAALALAAAPSTSLAMPSGITGYSGQGGTTCTSCHSGGTTPTVVITGPATLTPGQVGNFQLKITGGPGVQSGLDVSANAGALATADTSTRLSSGEITHSSPKAFSAGAATYNFNWTAPSSAGTYTLYGAGLSSNGTGTGGDGTGRATLAITVSSAPPPVCTAGQTRSCYTGPAGTQGVGICMAGTQTCANNAWGTCTGQTLPATSEACDGLDNNCNGTVDEGCPTLCTNGQTRSCYDGPAVTQGVGICRAGTQTCSAGTWLACSGQILPAAAEVCGDSLDNNCSGQVDEGCAPPPPPPVCTAGQTRACYTGPAGTQGVGICKPGTQSCANNAWGACTGQVLPAAAEVCGDGLDNNCNGQVDEACTTPPPPTSVCTEGARRSCTVHHHHSTQTCVNGAWTACGGHYAPAREGGDDGDESRHAVALVTGFRRDSMTAADNTSAGREGTAALADAAGCSVAGGMPLPFAALGAVAALLRRRRHRRA